VRTTTEKQQSTSTSTHHVTGRRCLIDNPYMAAMAQKLFIVRPKVGWRFTSTLDLNQDLDLKSSVCVSFSLLPYNVVLPAHG